MMPAWRRTENVVTAMYVMSTRHLLTWPIGMLSRCLELYHKVFETIIIYAIFIIFSFVPIRSNAQPTIRPTQWFENDAPKTAETRTSCSAKTATPNAPTVAMVMVAIEASWFQVRVSAAALLGYTHVAGEVQSSHSMFSGYWFHVRAGFLF